jgi:hypothetical protein
MLVIVFTATQWTGTGSWFWMTSKETCFNGLIPQPKESYFLSEYDLENLNFIKENSQKVTLKGSSESFKSGILVVQLTIFLLNNLGVLDCCIHSTVRQIVFYIIFLIRKEIYFLSLFTAIVLLFILMYCVINCICYVIYSICIYLYIQCYWCKC